MQSSHPLQSTRSISILPFALVSAISLVQRVLTRQQPMILCLNRNQGKFSVFGWYVQPQIRVWEEGGDSRDTAVTDNVFNSMGRDDITPNCSDAPLFGVLLQCSNPLSLGVASARSLMPSIISRSIMNSIGSVRRPINFSKSLWF